MDPERWQRVKDICAAALEREPEVRGPLVASLCAGDAELQRDVDDMLRYATASGGLLEGPWREGSSEQPRDVRTGRTPWLPDRIGRYQVLRLIGEGGMGAVFEARQDEPQRIVALKLLKPGVAGSELLRRFAHETQALARLQHPGIAQIYEAGTTDTSYGIQPYFAMELIRGQELRSYVESRRLTVAERLQLMLRICDAVHHAHQRGLIHRDLKPGNILVDESGQPKVLDFGVARLTDVDAYVSRVTDAGQLVGTLAYMSPEQVLADPLALDIRSDVYTLGVILYELLAGRLPYETGSAFHDVTKAIREEEPKRLSALDAAYRGDLETIAAKALEKDKSRRYSSAEALAGDIRRYMQHEPISARAPSRTYQLRKFARRHRTLVGGLAAVFVVLVAGIIATATEAVRARRAQQAAVTAEQTARAVSDFLQNDLLAQAGASTQAGPNVKPDPDLKVRTALDRAAAVIGDKFKGQPLVEASVRQTIAQTYRDLGLYGEARAQTGPALEIRRRLLGDSHPDTLGSLNDLASVYWLQGKYAEAEPLFEELVRARSRTVGENETETLTAMNNLGLLYAFEGKYALAEPLLEKTLQLRTRLSGELHLETVVVTGNLAQLYDREGKYQQARALSERVIELRRRLSGPDHPETLTAMNNLSSILRNQGRYAEAEAVLDSTLAIRRRVLGNEHPNTLTTVNNLANIYVNEGRFAAAETLFRDLLTVRLRLLGEGHPNTILTEHNLGNVLRYEGRYEEAEQLVSRAFTIQRQRFGEDNPDTLMIASALAYTYALEGQYGRAKELLNATLERRIRVSGENHIEALLIQERLAFVQRSERDFAGAEALLAKVLAARRRVLSSAHPDTLGTGCSLGFVQIKQQKYAEAETTLRDTLGAFDRFEVDTWQRHNCRALLGMSLAAQGRTDQARQPLRDGYEGLSNRQASIGVPNLFYMEEARNAVARLN